MEPRGEERVAIPNSASYNHPPPPLTQQSPVKLPLAPILSTPPERRATAMAAASRRGTAIFSPTQTLEEENPDPPPTTDPAPPQGGGAAARYRECLKNHAASMGGHVVDGCGEFMPRGDDGTPEALRCAACDCHRNFHRRELSGDPPPPPQSQHHHRTTHNPLPRTQAPPHLKHFAAGPAMVSFGGGGAAAESSSEDLNVFRSGEGRAASFSGTKKRFRTKFSEEQKRRMNEFAAKIGWRIQKQDDEEVQQFCNQVGVKRQVFKVWMHNNKQAIKRRSSQSD